MFLLSYLFCLLGNIHNRFFFFLCSGLLSFSSLDLRALLLLLLVVVDAEKLTAVAPADDDDDF